MITDDIYEIKEHLGLNVVINTRAKQHQVVLEFIDDKIKNGSSAEKIMENLHYANDTPLINQWGTQSIALLDLTYWQEYIKLKTSTS